MGCVKYRVALLSMFLFLSACKSGIDHTLLETPEGVISKVSGKDEHDYSPYALAYYRAVTDRLMPPQPISIMNNKLKELFSIIEGQKIPCSLDEIVLNDVELLIKKLDATYIRDVPYRLSMIEAMTKALSADNLSERISEKLKICPSNDEYNFQELAKKWEKTLRSRLMLEVQHVRSAVLSPIGHHADKMLIPSIRARASVYSRTDAQISARHIKTLIEFLKHARECHEIELSVLEAFELAIKGLKKELEDLLSWPATEIADRNALSTAHQILMPLADALDVDHIPNLRVLYDALVVLNVVENEYLKELLEPLLWHEDSLYFEKTDAAELIKERLEDGKKFITFAIPEGQDADIFSEYLSLLHYDVFTLDLEKLRQNAHGLRLSSVQFIEWAQHIIAKNTKNNSNSLVFLKGIGALNYDTFLNDNEMKLDAMAHNFDKLVDTFSQHTIIAPISHEHEFLFIRSNAARSTKLMLPPLNLELSDKIIDYMVADKNRRELDGVHWSKRPYAIMAKIARSFGEKEYYLSRLISMSAQFDQQKIDQNIHDKKEEETLALLIAHNALKIEKKKIMNSRILRLSSAPIEWRLVHSREKLLAKKVSFDKSELARQIEEIFRAERERARFRAEAIRITNEMSRRAYEDQRIILEDARRFNEQQRGTNEQNRIAAENQRIAVENLRVADENQRSLNEQQRSQSETARHLQEQARQGAENMRLANEQVRLASEQLREQAEHARHNREVLRINLENARIANENFRAAGENQRQLAEQLRAHSEGLRNNSEIGRNNNEGVRHNREQARLVSEANRVLQENIRIQNEQARVNAELLRVQAEAQRAIAEAALRALLDNAEDLLQWQHNMEQAIQALRNNIDLLNNNLAQAFVQITRIRNRVGVIETQVNTVNRQDLPRIRELSEQLVVVVNQMMRETFMLQPVFNEHKQNQWRLQLLDALSRL